MSKNISLSALQKQNKEKYTGHIEVTLEGFNPIHIDKVWKPSKISTLLSEYFQAMRKELKTADVSVSGGYLYLLMLRHFSNLTIPKQIDKQLQWLDALVDSGYLSRLVSNLPVDQIDKVNDEIDGMLKNFKQIDDSVIEELKSIELKNEEVQDLVDEYISDDSE